MFALTGELFPSPVSLFSGCGLFFSVERSSFTICCKAGLVVLNPFSFCLSVKRWISPLNLNESLAGWRILGWRFFPFIMLNISCQSLLACRVSVAKSTDSLMGFLFYVCCFSHFAFNVLYLSNICQFAYMCFGVALLGFILPAALCASWIWLAISFPMLGKFSVIISSNIFLGPFSLLLGP